MSNKDLFEEYRKGFNAGLIEGAIQTKNVKSKGYHCDRPVSPIRNNQYMVRPWRKPFAEELEDLKRELNKKHF